MRFSILANFGIVDVSFITGQLHHLSRARQEDAQSIGS